MAQRGLICKAPLVRAGGNTYDRASKYVTEVNKYMLFLRIVLAEVFKDQRLHEPSKRVQPYVVWTLGSIGSRSIQVILVTTRSTTSTVEAFSLLKSDLTVT